MPRKDSSQVIDASQLDVTTLDITAFSNDQLRTLGARLATLGIITAAPTSDAAVAASVAAAAKGALTAADAAAAKAAADAALAAAQPTAGAPTPSTTTSSPTTRQPMTADDLAIYHKAMSDFRKAHAALIAWITDHPFDPGRPVQPQLDELLRRLNLINRDVLFWATLAEAQRQTGKPRQMLLDALQQLLTAHGRNLHNYGGGTSTPFHDGTDLHLISDKLLTKLKANYDAALQCIPVVPIFDPTHDAFDPTQTYTALTFRALGHAIAQYILTPWLTLPGSQGQLSFHNVLTDNSLTHSPNRTYTLLRLLHREFPSNTRQRTLVLRNLLHTSDFNPAYRFKHFVDFHSDLINEIHRLGPLAPCAPAFVPWQAPDRLPRLLPT